MSKFKIVMAKDDDGNLVRKFVPEEEAQDCPVYAVYGDYLKVNKQEIQTAKNALLENLFDVIRTLSERDDFWIVKELDEHTITVGWKVHFPEMDYSQDLDKL
jgi:hypothetical protein